VTFLLPSFPSPLRSSVYSTGKHLSTANGIINISQRAKAARKTEKDF
jgi:hypothetical protein